MNQDEKIFLAETKREIMYPFTNFKELIDYRIEKAGDIPIYSYTGEDGSLVTVMPAEYKRQYQAMSTWIYEQGFHRQNIAILAENSYAWVLTMQSIVCSNNVVLLLDKTMEIEHLANLLQTGEGKAIFYNNATKEKAISLNEKFNIPIYPIDNPEIYISEGRKLLDAGKTECINQKLDGKAMAFIMFTSGTTGVSKGVMLSQYNLIASITGASEMLDISGKQVYVLPFNHIYGVGSSHLCAVFLGTTLYINTNMRNLFKDFMEQKPRLLIVVPLIIELMYDQLWKQIRKSGMKEKVLEMIEENDRKGNVTPEEKREMFKDILALFGGKLERMVSGGAPLQAKFFKGFSDFGITIYEGYGITECSPVLSVNCEKLCKAGSVGKVVAGSAISIENPDADGMGEICAKGDNVMLGYFNMPEQTKEAMKDGWFHTGDKGWMDSEGYIYITGRLKNLIILSNGENVSPEEIEQKLYEIEAIREVIVYEKDNKIAAQIFLNEDYLKLQGWTDGEQRVRDAITALNRTVPPYKIISIVEFRDTPFERTSSNKIKRVL